MKFVQTKRLGDFRSVVDSLKDCCQVIVLYEKKEEGKQIRRFSFQSPLTIEEAEIIQQFVSQKERQS